LHIKGDYYVSYFLQTDFQFGVFVNSINKKALDIPINGFVQKYR